MLKQKLKDSLLFVLLAALVLGFFLAGLLLPDRAFSENENKMLEQLPRLSWANLVNGKFASSYEKYVADQFPLRDEWIAAKSVAEFTLLKSENNGVVYGGDGYLFQKYTAVDETALAKNTAAAAAFIDRAGAPVTVLLVPSSYAVLESRVPSGAPFADQAAPLAATGSALTGAGARFVELLPLLRGHADEYIYYRTDHHWTTYGAWLAYDALEEGGTRFAYDESKAVAVPGFLGTSYSRCKAFNAVPDVIRYFPALNGALTTTQSTGVNAYDSIYNLEQFEKRDKYSGFLYGNSSYVEIETEPGADKKEAVLLIRDSYADSLVPYLTAHYRKIVLVDPRYYNASFAELSQQGFDDIILLFGFENFASETKITNLAR